MTNPISSDNINLSLSPELRERLQLIAQRDNRSLTDVMLIALQEYAELEWDGEQSDETIKRHLIEGWKQAKSEQTIQSARDFLKELEHGE